MQSQDRRDRAGMMILVDIRIIPPGEDAIQMRREGRLHRLQIATSDLAAG